MEHEEGEVCSDGQKLMRMTHYDFINYKLTVFECCQVQTGPHAHARLLLLCDGKTSAQACAEAAKK